MIAFKRTARKPKNVIAQYTSKSKIFYDRVSLAISPAINRIHTANSRQNSRINRLKDSIFQKKSYSTLKTHQNCRDLLNIKTLIAKSLPGSSNLTPKNDESSQIGLNDFWASDLSHNSPSLLYPLENVAFPQLIEKNKIEIKTQSLASPEDRTKKMVISKPKITILSKDSNQKSLLLTNVNKMDKKPFKDLSELLLIQHTKKTQGKVRKGLCYSHSRSPVPKLLHNIKISSGQEKD